MTVWGFFDLSFVVYLVFFDIRMLGQFRYTCILPLLRRRSYLRDGGFLTSLRVRLAGYHCLGAYVLFFGSVDFLFSLVIFSAFNLHLAHSRAVRQLGKHYGRKMRVIGCD